jgi:hypothetical protein
MMTLEQTVEIPADHRLFIEVPEEIPAGTATFRLEWIKPPEKPKKDAAWVNPLKGRAKAFGSKLTLDRFMEMQEADKKLELDLES